MNVKQIGLEAVFIGFSALSAYALYQHGYVGFFELLLANAATITAFADLTIALSLVLLWMWRDARERGSAFLPYLALTLTLGSVGPLLYLIRRTGSEQIVPARTPVRAVHS